MRHYSLFILYFSLLALSLNAQSQNLQLILKDKTTNEPVDGAHAFILNTSFGSISNSSGELTLDVPVELKESLVISHLGFKNLFIPWLEYQNLSTPAIVHLESNGLSLEEITIVASRDKNWKRNYNRFKKAFLGEDKAAGKTQILNPEVLRFHNTDETLKVTAIDLIKISNKYLGYDLDFLLKELVIEEDGSSYYHGFAKFTDSSSAKETKNHLKRRMQVFKNSRRHFLLSLIQNSTKEQGYEINFLNYSNGVFSLLSNPDPDTLIIYNESDQSFAFAFTEFLNVKNKNLKLYSSNIQKEGGNVFRNQFVDGLPSVGRGQKQYAQSQLYKISNFLKLDKYGHILNEKDVKEYGYWASQRVANLLPWDYGVEFSIQTSPSVDLEFFQSLIYGDLNVKTAAIKTLSDNWDNSFLPPLLEILRLSADNQLTNAIQNLLNNKIGREHVGNYYSALEHIWKSPQNYGSYYGNFKAEIYRHVDPLFQTYFKDRQNSSRIRLDEILWGGVLQDGIPPLRFPKMISADQADYLDDNDVVFGIHVNGFIRAYPKRIIAWHEFFVDSFANLDIAGVYCTLCGTIIAYDMTYEGIRHDLGTSGFLYRSNKLMYDKATQSLWNTIEGKPVLGPLAKKDIVLETYPIVTSTWGAWKKLHPETEVLSLKTGHSRDYDEGVAYQKYFATDELMFPVPIIDDRLANKDEVFIVRVPGYEQYPKAFSQSFLKKHRLHRAVVANTSITILTDDSGASRAYDTKDHVFVSLKKMKLFDENGLQWSVGEDGIKSGENLMLKRVSAHNIFWFAWLNAYPETLLVK